MDGYPKSVAPDFEETGAVATPFCDWWARVRNVFPAVPLEVAHYWLHEHWGHSPYGYLSSKQYRFEQETWGAEDLLSIRSGWNNFNTDLTECAEHGRYLINEVRLLGYPTAVFMNEYCTFPVSIICLDNRDGHLTDKNSRPSELNPPPGLILIEGHRRFNMALFLLEQNRLKSEFVVWVMKRQ